MFISSIIFGLLSLYALFNICWNITKMKFMISIIKLATHFLYHNLSIIFIPIIFFFLIIITLLIWIASALAVLSSE